MARIPLKFIPDLKTTISGAWTQQVGFEVGQVIVFAGNYWADVWLEEGEDIYRKRGGFKPDADHPWIGDPDDPVSMEKAMKFRKALNIAIDREAIIREVQAGLGRPSYNVVNAFPGDDHWKDEWTMPYDTAAAKALLAEAGVSAGFGFKVHVAPGKEWDEEVGQAVAQYWRELGLNVEVDRTAYVAARPRLV
jgi:ABC-type transport system substrate-binding protein